MKVFSVIRLFYSWARLLFQNRQASDIPTVRLGHKYRQHRWRTENASSIDTFCRGKVLPLFCTLAGKFQGFRKGKGKRRLCNSQHLLCLSVKSNGTRISGKENFPTHHNMLIKLNVIQAALPPDGHGMLQSYVNHDSPTTSGALRNSGWISSTPGALPPRSFLSTSATSDP